VGQHPGTPEVRFKATWTGRPREQPGFAPEGRPRCCVGDAAIPDAEQQERPTEKTRGTTGRGDRRTVSGEAARSLGPPTPRAPTPIGRSCGAAPLLSIGRTAHGETAAHSDGSARTTAGSASRRSAGKGRFAAREPALAALDERQPVEALKMSSLPKLAGQSLSGHGAGNTRCPALNDAWRQTSMAGQSAARRVSVHTPAPYVRVAIA
jgi:hypothetical protein